MRKKVMRIATDSRPMEEPKDPETDLLYQLYCLFADESATAEMANIYRAGGFGYGDIKKTLADAAEEYFAEARDRREALAAQPDRVRQILGDGAQRARQKAGEVLKRAQQACGLTL